MYVKICGLREPGHVTAAVEAGADAIGFVLTASPRRVTPERAAELARPVPAHVLTVGVFRGEDPATVRAAALAAGVRAIQLHGAHPHDDFTALKDLGLTLVRAVDAAADLRCGAHDEHLLIVDAPRPGSGEPWDWAAVRGRPSGRWMLAGGLGPANVAEAVAAAAPWGVDVSSGVEVAPGVKDPKLIAEFVRAARRPG
ncbi:phosphoribosylanthranilate isomerase [Nonomuraea cavernae]|uniref:N-(5'-phosphoribosyl)anthranilate isomerase n=1 Tax=Nonomuraea cavernae TaxID=2045107 RepID=A0A918DGT8_9ACTN|nr:phosphoribosylanthranilate isomerase [Nonomuraea cavernae]MCA2184479.1 phosphoribosylanthranilate isomerase [Nonomuraea cavernae]GGO63665.1 N-(5'-phosphoribosyl)anthranilate isomerase [Nonomuraea cavernae]